MPNRDEKQELREVCVGFAVQAGADTPVGIVSLAEALKQYIETGASPTDPELLLRQFI